MADIPLLKVVVVGDGAVGKTTLIRRYTEGKFHASRVATIGVDFYTQQVQLPTGMVKLSIWDMAGQDRFEVVRAGFYRGSQAAALGEESLVRAEARLLYATTSGKVYHLKKSQALADYERAVVRLREAIPWLRNR